MFVYSFLFTIFSYLPSLLVFLFPLVFSLAAAFMLWKTKRKRLYLFVCVTADCVFLLFFLSHGSVSLSLFAEGGVAFLQCILFPVYKLKIHRKKKGDKIKEFTEEFMREGEERIESNFPQKKVLCYTDDIADGDDDYRLNNEQISLNHVISLAVQLKKAKLAVGDRLETDSIYKTLTSFRSKNNLTGEEMDALNNYLARLLKLTAKYSL